MALNWKDFSGSDYFKGLPETEQGAARQRFFDDQVAPRFAPEQRESALAEFNRRTMTPATVAQPAQAPTSIQRPESNVAARAEAPAPQQAAMPARPVRPGQVQPAAAQPVIAPPAAEQAPTLASAAPPEGFRAGRPSTMPTDMASTRPEDQDDWQITKGLKAGVAQTKALGYGLKALAGDALGMKDWERDGMSGYRREMEEAALHPGRVQKIEEINGLGDAVDWALYGAGTQIPTLASMVVTGGAAGAAYGLAAKGLTKKVAASLIEKNAAKLIAAGTARNAAYQAATKAVHATAAGVVGSMAGGAALEMPSIYGDTYDFDKNEGNAGVAATFGAVAGALEAIPGVAILKRMGLGKMATEEIAQGLLKDRTLGAVIDGMVREGATEGLQTIIERAAGAWVDENKEIFSSEGWSEIKNAMALGAMFGGGIEGGTQFIQNRMKTKPVQPGQPAGQPGAQPPADDMPSEEARTAAFGEADVPRGTEIPPEAFAQPEGAEATDTLATDENGDIIIEDGGDAVAPGAEIPADRFARPEDAPVEAPPAEPGVPGVSPPTEQPITDAAAVAPPQESQESQESQPPEAPIVPPNQAGVPPNSAPNAAQSGSETPLDPESRKQHMNAIGANLKVLRAEREAAKKAGDEALMAEVDDEIQATAVNFKRLANNQAPLPTPREQAAARPKNDGVSGQAPATPDPKSASSLEARADDIAARRRGVVRKLDQFDIAISEAATPEARAAIQRQKDVVYRAEMLPLMQEMSALQDERAGIVSPQRGEQAATPTQPAAARPKNDGIAPPPADGQDDENIYADARTQDPDFKNWMEQATRGLVTVGEGNLSQVVDPNFIKGESDKGDTVPMIRSSSVNPQWWQDLAAVEGVSVEYARKVVGKVKAGAKLRVQERRVARKIMDAITEDRIGELEDWGRGLGMSAEEVAGLHNDNPVAHMRALEAEVSARQKKAADAEVEQQWAEQDAVVAGKKPFTPDVVLGEDAPDVDGYDFSDQEAIEGHVYAAAVGWGVPVAQLDGLHAQAPDAESFLSSVRNAIREIRANEKIRSDQGEAGSVADIGGPGAPESGESAAAEAERLAGIEQARAEAIPALEEYLGTDWRKDNERRARLAAASPDELVEEVYRDKMTGLLNKRAWNEDTTKAGFEKQGRRSKPYAIAYIDLDGLKFLNDQMGHSAGDELLANFGAAMKAAGIDGYHISGDEFGAIFENEADASEAMDRLQREVESSVVRGKSKDGRGITNTGIAFSYGLGGSANSADMAMQDNKKAREAQGLRTRGGMPSTAAYDEESVLQPYDQAAIDAKAAEDKARAKKDADAAAKQKADDERGDFVLAGSARPADQAAARGAQDMFSGGAPAAPAAPKAKPSANTVFTEDAAAAARERLRAKLGRPQTGLDPESVMDGITLAGYHIERGARTFSAYAKAMLADLGDAVRPYLKSWYVAISLDPRAAAFDGMDSYDAVKAVDVDAITGGPEVDPINAAAHEAATSPQNDLPHPTEAQKDAGNYQKGHVTWNGLDITIENPAGSKRRPEWPTLAAHYGYLKRTEGADGDHVDVFINPDENRADTVFVIDQLNGGKAGAGFDEHKVMLGFKDKGAAIAAYKGNYTKGWHVGPATEMSVDEFKAWLKDGDLTKPAGTADVRAIPPNERPARTDQIGSGTPKAVETPGPLDMDGFLDGATTLVRSRAAVTLGKNVQNNGRIISRLALIREKVDAGSIVVVAKDGRRLQAADGVFLDEAAITKTGMDYAEHLIAKRGAAPAESPAVPAAESPAWHTEIPTEGLALTAEQKAGKGMAYERIPGIVAADALDSVTQAQKMGELSLYLYALPAEGGRNGIARLFPEDQKPPAPWVLANGEAVRIGWMTREQSIAKLTGMLRNAPIVGDAQSEPPAAKPVSKPKPADLLGEEQKPKTRIADFGERIEGAAKYRDRYTDQMAEAMEADIAAVPLSESWPEPDYEKMLEEGADPGIVAFVHAARDEIPVKPKKRWKVAGWTEAVRLLRDVSNGLINGSIPADKFRETLAKPEFMRVARDVGGRADLYQAVGHGVSLKGVTLRARSFSRLQPDNSWKEIRDWGVEREAKASAFGNWPQELGVGNTREEAIAAFKAKHAEMAGAEKPDAQTSFEIYRYRANPGVVVIGKKIGKDRVDLAQFPTLAEARAYLKDNHDALVAKLEAYKKIPRERRLTNEPRVGVNHRNGGNVTEEQFKETFGFRGGQFGSSLLSAQKEAQAHLNESYDALMDLAGVLGVPPKALSLNGELALAFAARGRGGVNAAAAHYERDTKGVVTDSTVVINLTRKHGAGSLAHEWFHALDNYFARARKERGGMLTERPFPRGEGVRPEMVAAFKNLMDTIKRTALEQRSMALDKRRTKIYWSTGLEMSARSFESYIIEKLRDQGASNDYLANIVSPEYWAAEEALRDFAQTGNMGEQQEQTYPYPTAAEIPAIRAAFDHFFQTIETKETDKGIAIQEGEGVYSVESRGKKYGDRASQPIDDLFGLFGDPYENAEQRPGTTEKQRDLGRDALRDLSRRIGLDSVARRFNAGGSAPSILGAGLVRNFVAGQPNSLIGGTIQSPRDLAALAQVYRDPRFETFRIAYLKGNTVVGEAGYSSRMPGIVDMGNGFVADVSNDMDRFGADGYYAMHNHPSGKSAPSTADANLTIQLAAKVPGFRGHVVIDHNEYSVLDASGRHKTIQDDKLGSADFRADPVVQSDLLGAIVAGPRDVVDLAKRVQKPDMATVVMTVAGETGRVNLVVDLPADALRSHAPRMGALIRRMARGSGSGGNRFLVLPDGYPKAAFQHLITYGVFTDVVGADGTSSVEELPSLYDVFRRRDVLTKGLKGARVYEPEALYSRGAEEEEDAISKAKQAAIAARNAFRAIDRTKKIEDADSYFDLSSKMSDAKSAFADALGQIPADQFALRGMTSDGRILLLTPSAQRPGFWQLTRFDINGEPWGDTQYPTREQATREFLDDATPESVTDHSAQFSRGDSAKGHTEAALYDRLRGLFGPKFMDRLFQTGRFRVITGQDAASILGMVDTDALRSGGAVRGFYHRGNGITYLVADSIPAKFTDAQLKGLMRHEIGVHALKAGRDSAGWQSILGEIDRLIDSGDKAVHAAFLRAGAAGTRDVDLLEEVAGYLVEDAPSASIVRRILAWLKDQVYKLTGLQLKLTDADVVAMAQAALRAAPRALSARASASMVAQPAYSAPAPVWVSALKQRIAEQGAKTRTGNDWSAWLQGNAAKLGIKKDEIEWSGITDYLAARGKDKLATSDIVQWLDANGVRVSEVERGQRDNWRQRLDLLETRGFANLSYREQEEVVQLRDRRERDDVSEIRRRLQAALLFSRASPEEVDQSRRRFVVGMAATGAALAGGGYVEATAGDSTKLGQAQTLADGLLRENLPADVVALLRGKGSTAFDGAQRVRKALEMLAASGPESLRDLAGQLAALMPADNLLLTIDNTTIENAHGSVELSPIPHMTLFAAENRTGLTFGTFLHESMHVAAVSRYHSLSMGVLRHNDTVLGMPAPKAEFALAQFRSLWNEFQAEAKLEKSKDKALRLSLGEASRTPDEFFVRSLTDGTLRGWMATREYKGRTLLERFKDWVKYSLFGLKKTGTVPSWLDAALAGTTDLLRDMAGDAPNFARTDAVLSLSEKAGDPMFSRAQNPVQGALVPPAQPSVPPQQGTLSVQGGATGPGAQWTAPPATPLGAFIDTMLYRYQDKHIDLKRTQQGIKAAGRQINEASDAYLKEELFHGRAATRAKEFLEDELDPLVADMRARGVEQEDLGRYLWARHAQEANEHIAAINPALPDGGSGMLTQEAQDYLAALTPQQQADYAALAARVDAITQTTRNALVNDKLISAQQRQDWESAYQHYVPLFRELDANDDIASLMMQGAGTGQGYSIKGAESKRRTGSQLPVADILGNIANARDKAIVRGEKARVGRALYAMALTNKNPDFWRTAVAAPTIKTHDKNGMVIEIPDPLFKQRDNVVVVKVPTRKGNIVERAVIFNERDPRAARMARAIKNLDGQQLGEFLGAAASVTRYFASINTQYNPIFGVVNLTRDVQTAMLNLSSTPLAGKQAAVAADIARIVGGALKHGLRDFDGPWKAIAREFEEAGGMTGYRDMFRSGRERTEAIEKALDPNWWQKRPWGKVLTADGYLKAPAELMVDKGVRPVMEWLSDYNQVLENATRLAAYKQARDMGLSKDASASIAKNLTVNFNRKGEMALQLGALYAFFNAATQGIARMGQTFAGPAGKYIVGGGVLVGALQAMLLAAAGYDDEEPKQFVRERALILPTPWRKEKYFSLPMPLGFHVLPNFGRLTVEAMQTGDVMGKTASMMGVMADAFNPLGGSAPVAQILSPTATDPFISLGMNRDWTNSPIAREDFSNLHPTPGFTRARDAAGAPARWLAKALNRLSGGTDYTQGLISPTPDQIEYLAGQLTGGIGREAIKASTTATSIVTGDELPMHKVPLIGRFYGSTEGRAPQANKFYSNLKRLNEHGATVKGLRADRRNAEVMEYLRDNPDARLYEAAGKAERKVSELRARRRAMVERDASKAELKRVDDLITAQMVQLNDRMKALQE